ncbi:MAG: hypothetical protein GX049_03450 [Alcaligenaceae bacterium]|nr:hypothetical protein [Alcaligenaceae bacterium]
MRTVNDRFTLNVDAGMTGGLQILEGIAILPGQALEQGHRRIRQGDVAGLA